MSNYTKNLNLFKYDPINDAKVPFNIEKCLNENWDKLDNLSTGMPVGTIITSTASSSYTPENTVYTDGTEYAEAQFTKTYSLLESGQLESCTYEEYENSITQTGECWICALDTANQKFKVPTIKDIVVRGIKDTIEVGYGNGVKRANGEDVSGQPVDISGFGPVSGGYASLMYSNIANSPVYGNSSELGNSALQADTQGSLITQTIRHYYVVATGSINQSEMDWSAWASGQANKLNIDHSNDTKPYITETYVNGKSGYIVYSNGFCQQWGYLVEPRASTGTISLLKNYKDTNYFVIAPIDGSDCDACYVANVTSRSTSDFSFASRYTPYANRDVAWMAFGYIN